MAPAAFPSPTPVPAPPSFPAAPFDFDAAPPSDDPFASPGVFGGGPSSPAPFSLDPAPQTGLGQPGLLGGFADDEVAAANAPIELPLGTSPVPPGTLPVVGFDAAPSPVVSRQRIALQRRQRRKRALMRMVIPLTTILTLVAAYLMVQWKPAPKLEGKLKATGLGGTFSLSPRYLSSDLAGLPSDAAQQTLEALGERPELLVSDRMRMRLGGDPKRGLEVTVEPGVQMRFVRLEIKQHAALSNYCSFEKETFNLARLEELKPALKKLLVDYDTALKANTKIHDLPGFRDPVGLAGMTHGVGYVVHAVAGNSPFRCVGEDSEGRLYFLLPSQTTSFVLTGRKLADGTTPFQGKYTVDVELPADEPDEPSKPSGKAKDDEEMPSPFNPGKKPARKDDDTMKDAE